MCTKTNVSKLVYKTIAFIRENYLVIIVIFAALFLRVFLLDKLPTGIYIDEAMNGNNAVEALRNHKFATFYFDNNGREGLFINIQALFIFFLGAKIWVLRFASALVGTLTILGVYLFLKEFLNNKISSVVGLFTSALLAFNFWDLIFSRTGLRVISGPLVIIYSLYFLARALNSEVESKRFYLNTVISGLIFGIGVSTYISFRSMPLMIITYFVLLFLIKRIDWKIALKSLLIFGFCSILTALPMLFHFYRYPADFWGRTKQVSVFEGTTAAETKRLLARNSLRVFDMFYVHGDGMPRQNFFEAPAIDRITQLLIVIGFLGVLANITRNDELEIRRRILVGFSLVGMFLGVLPAILTVDSSSLALRSFLAITFVFTLAGIGFSYLYEKLFKYKIVNILLIVYGFMLFVTVYNQYFVVWANDKNAQELYYLDGNRAAEKINSLPRDVRKYVISEKGGMVRGVPTTAQPTMFLTDTFDLDKRKQKNVIYTDTLTQEMQNDKEGVILFITNK